MSYDERDTTYDSSSINVCLKGRQRKQIIRNNGENHFTVQEYSKNVPFSCRCTLSPRLSLHFSLFFKAIRMWFEHLPEIFEKNRFQNFALIFWLWKLVSQVRSIEHGKLSNSIMGWNVWKPIVKFEYKRFSFMYGHQYLFVCWYPQAIWMPLKIEYTNTPRWDTHNDKLREGDEFAQQHQTAPKIDNNSFEIS